MSPRRPRRTRHAEFARRLALGLGLAVLVAGAGYEWGGPAKRGIRQLKEGKPRDAATSFEEARRERPYASAIRFDQALAFEGLGLPDSARAAYSEARNLEGAAGRAAAAYNQANAAYNAGRFDEAIEGYRAALRDDPKRADAKRNMEEALRRSRDSNRKQLQGSSGTSGNGSGGSGQRQGGNTPPPPNGPSAPNPSQGSGKQGAGNKPSLGAPNPSREEAEHWLDALEAERRAGRNRDQAAKRSSGESRSDRDW